MYGLYLVHCMKWLHLYYLFNLGKESIPHYQKFLNSKESWLCNSIEVLQIIFLMILNSFFFFIFTHLVNVPQSNSLIICNIMIGPPNCDRWNELRNLRLNKIAPSIYLMGISKLVLWTVDGPVHLLNLSFQKSHVLKVKEFLTKMSKMRKIGRSASSSVVRTYCQIFLLLKIFLSPLEWQLILLIFSKQWLTNLCFEYEDLMNQNLQKVLKKH